MAYQGLTARLPIGRNGFTGSKNPSQIGAGFLTFCDGLALDAGIFKKEGGASKLNAAAVDGGADVLAGISWSPAPGTKYDAIFTSGGKILRDDGAGTFATTYVSGLTSTAVPPPYFLVAGGEAVGEPRKLFLFSNSNQVQVVHGTGATMAAISAPPADWISSFPPIGVQHKHRLWGGGNSSDPHRMYYSTLTDHEEFVAAGSGTIAVFPGEGDFISGGLSFKGVLVVFKYPSGIYVIDTSDLTPANWSVYKLSGAVGAANQQVIVPIENDVVFMDHAGDIHSLASTQVLGSVMTSMISLQSNLGPFMRSDVNTAEIRRACGMWYETKRQVWFGLPLVGAIQNGLRLIADFNAPDVGIRFLTSYRDAPVSLWPRYNSSAGVVRPASGDGSGFVWLMDQDDRNKDGAAYDIRFETPNMDMSFLDQSLSTKSKNGQFLEIVLEPKGDWVFTVEAYWDDVLTDIIQFAMGSSGSPLGSFELGLDVLSSDVVRSNRQPLAGSGRRLKLIGYNEGLNQDVAIAEFWFSFQVADERIREDA